MRQTVRLIVIVVVLAAAFATGRWTQAQAPLPPAQQPTPPQRGLAPVGTLRRRHRLSRG